METEPVTSVVTRMVEAAARVTPAEVLALLGLMRQLLGATTARLHVADYSLRRLQELDRNGPVGEPRPIAGTLIGRAFLSGEVLVIDGSSTSVLVPLVDGSSPIGVLELAFERWDAARRDVLDAIAAVFTMAWIVKGRYTDTSARARRSEPLSAAAEIQWDLLPPLSCAAGPVALSGILEPAYAIGGDSFDYAVEPDRVDFTIVDAIGHGMSAVLMSAAAINSLRNSRRAHVGIAAAYERADRTIASQFGDDYYVTGVIGALDLVTGVLTWISAGHVPPMLVRNGTYVGPLPCRPSLPFGLGGPIAEIAEQALQPGDRVLLYTDGITEARGPDGTFFGDDRLADLLVRASLERLPAQQTVRHLADTIVAFAGLGLNDDATMLLLEYRPAPT